MACWTRPLPTCSWCSSMGRRWSVLWETKEDLWFVFSGPYYITSWYIIFVLGNLSLSFLILQIVKLRLLFRSCEDHFFVNQSLRGYKDHILTSIMISQCIIWSNW
jgi:hypothetical protein